MPSPLPDTLLAILRCPETRQKLVAATAEQVAAMNAKRNSGADAITAALVREDGLVAYPIDDGYPVLLLERQIRAGEGSAW